MVINLNGSISYRYLLQFLMFFVSYFPNFLWSPFLKFFRYFFQEYKRLFISEKSQCFLYQNITIVWFEFDLIKPSAFWHLFLKITNILIIYSLVVITSFLMIENSMGHDLRIWWVVSYKSVSCRKGMRFWRGALIANKLPIRGECWFSCVTTFQNNFFLTNEILNIWLFS